QNLDRIGSDFNELLIIADSKREVSPLLRSDSLLKQLFGIAVLGTYNRSEERNAQYSTHCSPSYRIQLLQEHETYTVPFSAFDFLVGGLGGNGYATGRSSCQFR